MRRAGTDSTEVTVGYSGNGDALTFKDLGGISNSNAAFRGESPRSCFHCLVFAELWTPVEHPDVIVHPKTVESRVNCPIKASH